MGLSDITLFAAAAGLIGFLRSSEARKRGLLLVSVLAVFWLQPTTPIRHIDFWLPLATLALVALTWSVTMRRNELPVRQELPTALVILGLITLLGLTRYLPLGLQLSGSRPPVIGQILIVVAISVLTLLVLLRPRWPATPLLALAGLIIVLLFIVLKSDVAGTWVSSLLRRVSGQDTHLAAPVDLRWFGYSYLAFRLLHTLRERRSGRLPHATLREYMIYALFFPSLAAGPIDRVERFLEDLRREGAASASRLIPGIQRILIGLFKKFVLADTLALVALNHTNAQIIPSASGLWFSLYAFSFQLFLDFSAYTDVAIGMGLLVGIRLPENFHRPYLQPNPAAFWRGWHITLTEWFRVYVFNPVVRALRSRGQLPPGVIILLGQILTMVLIGLWHGINANFILWGLWHGAGLFVHNRWQELWRRRAIRTATPQHIKILGSVAGVVATFHFVSLGWIWFILDHPAQSLSVLLRLFGV